MNFAETQNCQEDGVKPEGWVSEEEMTFETPLFMLLPAPS